MREVFVDGEYQSVLAAKLRDVKLIVDLGANVGYTVRLWHSLFPEAEIVAVEPDPGNASLCIKNAELGGCGNRVKLIQACVGAEAREASLSQDGGAWGYAMSDDALERGIPVQVLTLPQILHQTHSSGPIDLLKCDIEGAECELFAAPQEWLWRVRCMIIELHAPFTMARLMLNIKNSGVEFSVFAACKNNSLVCLVRA